MTAQQPAAGEAGEGAVVIRRVRGALEAAQYIMQECPDESTATAMAQHLDTFFEEKILHSATGQRSCSTAPQQRHISSRGSRTWVVPKKQPPKACRGFIIPCRR
eukprot:4411348-Pyramimonas_sp.AAC.2